MIVMFFPYIFFCQKKKKELAYLPTLKNIETFPETRLFFFLARIKLLNLTFFYSRCFFLFTFRWVTVELNMTFAIANQSMLP